MKTKRFLAAFTALRGFTTSLQRFTPSLRAKRSNPAFIALLALLVLPASCSNDATLLPDDNGAAIEVQFVTPTAVTTRLSAGGATWASSDEVGIFMLKAGRALSAANIAEGADNRKFTMAAGSAGEATAGFTPAATTETIYYPQATGENVDFIAYYPYRATPGTDPYIYKVSLAGQNTAAGQAAIDLLYSNNVNNKARSRTEAAELQFNHALARLVINVKARDGMTSADYSASGLTVALNGFPTTADFSLANGSSFTSPGGTAAIVPLRHATASNPASYKATYEALLIPQSAGATGRTVTFATGGETHTWALPSTIAFAQGKTHTYEVTVKRHGVTVSPVTITDWTNTGNSTPGTAVADMVKIKAGTFRMGQEDISDAAPHQVTLTKDFYMGKYQVTTAQYCAFLNANKDVFTVTGTGASATVKARLPAIGSFEESDYIIAGDKDGDKVLLAKANAGTITYDDGTSLWSPVTGYENHPMTYVTWYGAFAFAEWLGGRLPTEAEWEYACRAGTTTPWSFGDTDANIGDYAWYSGNNTNDGYPSGIKPVGLKLPNPWGLYDMHGNVWEWCYDWSDTYTASGATDPVDTTQSTSRVLRGGAYYYTATYCRSAYRGYYVPAHVSANYGFRVVFPL